MWNREQNGLHLIIRACNSQLIKQSLCLNMMLTVHTLHAFALRFIHHDRADQATRGL